MSVSGPANIIVVTVVVMRKRAASSGNASASARMSMMEDPEDVVFEENAMLSTNEGKKTASIGAQVLRDDSETSGDIELETGFQW